jgi:hypothetical protein
MPHIIKVSEHWIVVKTSMLSEGDKAGLIEVGFSYPLLKSGAENKGILLRKRIAGETVPTNVAGLITLYSKPTETVYGEISSVDMAELEDLIAKLIVEGGGRRKSRKIKSRKSRKIKSRKSRKINV